MKTNEVLRELMEKDDMRFNAFADRLGLKPNALASRMKRGNFSTDVLSGMLDVFGYKMVIVPKDTKMEDGWYDVEDSHDTPTPVEQNAEDSEKPKQKNPEKTKKAVKS